MKQIKFILFGIVFGVAGFLIGLGMQADDAKTSVQQDARMSEVLDKEEERQISIMIDTEDDLLGFSDITLQNDDTVYSVLSRLAEENENLELDVIDYGDLGMFINAINGKQSGNDNKYWQYWVNNEYGTVSADNYILREGDVILWKFTSSRYENF